MNDLFKLDDDSAIRNVSIHLRNLCIEDLDLLSEVLHVTGEKTQAKALLEAYSGYLLYRGKYADLEKRYLELVKKYN